MTFLSKDGFIIAKGDRHANLSKAVYAKTSDVELMTKEELDALPNGSPMIYDVETYPNFWFVAFKSLVNNKFAVFEDSPDRQLDTIGLGMMLWRFLLIGFNSRTYDLPMVSLAMAGFPYGDLYHASMRIIGESLPPFIVEKEYKIKIPSINHIDLIEVAPLRASLKTYAGRLHCPRMQDLPYSPQQHLKADEAQIVRRYCCNDLDNTELMALHLRGAIKQREELSREYGIDLRSKSDAQIAEAVITSELTKLTGRSVDKPRFDADVPIRYDAPAWIEFEHSETQRAFAIIQASAFYIDNAGSARMPTELDGLKIAIGRGVYRLGIGGLHSSEKSTAHVVDDSTRMFDVDVASFYPRIILNESLYPKHLGTAFLDVYQSLVNKRLTAKRQGNKIVADALKITINGSFGKLGNQYSALFAPDLLLQVTITGQLALLMLIERIESVGIPVVSGNTDGIVIKAAKSDYELLRMTVQQWELATGFETEEVEYKALYSRDINNYIAVKLNGECKTKGIYSEVGSALNSPLSKNPETLICSDAVQAMISHDTPIRKTIQECTDIKRFVTVRTVKGGAEKNGIFLGKVVRWYYAKNEAGCINYVISGNKVPKSDGAKPLMDLPEAFPSDMNYEWYENEAKEMLYDLGFYRKAKTLSLF